MKRQGEDNLTLTPTCMTVSSWHIPHRIATVACSFFVVSLPARAQVARPSNPIPSALAGRPLRRRPDGRRARRADAGSAAADQHRRGPARVPDPLRRRGGRLDPGRPRAGDGRPLGRRPAPRRRRAGAAPLGPVGLGVQGRLGDGAGRERRLGRDAHLLPRRRLLDPARQPDRHPGDRPPLRHAGVRHRQVAERHRRQAGHRSTSPPTDLARDGRSFGFGETIPFELPVEPSHLDVPADNGWSSRAPRPGSGTRRCRRMHGALLAATIANRGEMPLTDADRARRRRGRPPGAAPGRRSPPRRRPARRRPRWAA